VTSRPRCRARASVQIGDRSQGQPLALAPVAHVAFAAAKAGQHRRAQRHIVGRQRAGVGAVALIDRRLPGQPFAGVALGIAAALAIIGLEARLHRVPAHNMVGALVGGVTGLLGASLVWGVIQGLDLVAEHFIHSVVIVFLIYIGIVIGARRGEWFEPARIIAAFQDSARLHQYKILDTSVIIDGRVADVVEAGFLEGTLVVPSFVLRELQHIADSSDPLKRNRNGSWRIDLHDQVDGADINTEFEGRGRHQDLDLALF